jgi:competence protein ComEC
VESLTVGDTFTFGTEVSNSFEILHPDTNCFVVYQNENDCSLVGLLTYGSHTFLFTGDIGKKVEVQIMDKIKDKVTVLKVAHHGSNGSSDSVFLEKIKPQYSVLSLGENSYRHPHPEVLDRLRVASTTIFNTKEDATIVASSDGDVFQIKKLFDKTSFFKSSICAILLYGLDTSC